MPWRSPEKSKGPWAHSHASMKIYIFGKQAEPSCRSGRRWWLWFPSGISAVPWSFFGKRGEKHLLSHNPSALPWLCSDYTKYGMNRPGVSTSQQSWEYLDNPGSAAYVKALLICIITVAGPEWVVLLVWILLLQLPPAADHLCLGRSVRKGFQHWSWQRMKSSSPGEGLASTCLPCSTDTWVQHQH